MGKDRSTSKRLLKSPKGFLTCVGEIPSCTFPSKSGERDDGIRVSINESSVEVIEPEKGLNVLDIPRFWLFQNCLDFVRGHPEALWAEDVTEIFNSIGVELTFVCVSIKPVDTEMSEDFSDMFVVFLQVIGVDQDVIKIYNHEDIYHVSKNVIHEALESGRGIGKSKWHNQLFERPVAGSKGGFPLISIYNAD